MKSKPLSDLEQKVMNIVWIKKQCTVRNILDEIKKNKRIAYTTVLTILQRLNDKGFIIKKEDGKAFIYMPRISKEVYSKSLVKVFLKKFFDSFGDIGIASFADSIDALSKKERAYLLEVLEHHNENK